MAHFRETFCPKGSCGLTFWPKLRFYLPKRPLRVDILAQNIILSSQKAPARRLSSPNYEFISPKSPCGSTFWPKVPFCPPKRPLRVDFLAQVKNLSAQKAPAGPKLRILSAQKPPIEFWVIGLVIYCFSQKCVLFRF